MNSKSLVHEIAKLLDCEPNELENRLNHPLTGPLTRDLVGDFLKGRKFRTLYPSSFLDSVGELKFVEWTPGDAYETKPFWNYKRYSDVTADQYYHARFGIVLLYPTLPLVTAPPFYTWRRYYPLEVLEFIPDPTRKPSVWDNVTINSVEWVPLDENVNSAD